MEIPSEFASKSNENESQQPASDKSDTYFPYQPALAAGISEEMDRLNARRIALAEHKARGELSAEEEAEFARLQATFFSYLKTINPRPSILDDDRLEKLEQKYASAK